MPLHETSTLWPLGFLKIGQTYRIILTNMCVRVTYTLQFANAL